MYFGLTFNTPWLNGGRSSQWTGRDIGRDLFRNGISVHGVVVLNLVNRDLRVAHTRVIVVLPLVVVILEQWTAAATDRAFAEAGRVESRVAFWS